MRVLENYGVTGSKHKLYIEKEIAFYKNVRNNEINGLCCLQMHLSSVCGKKAEVFACTWQGIREPLDCLVAKSHLRIIPWVLEACLFARHKPDQKLSWLPQRS